jgi:hypothetical protein
MFIMSGARIVEMCSVVMCYGYSWLGKQVEALENFMDERGYCSVAECLGPPRMTLWTTAICPPKESGLLTKTASTARCA